MCDGCGFAWADPFVAGDEDLYAILHEDGAFPKWRWEYGGAMEILKQLPPGPVLDIGAGDGRFLKDLPAAFVPWATENSDSARKALVEAGVKVSPDLGTLERTHGESFSAICMFQVFEHLADFKNVLVSSRRLMRRDGRLLISVPYGKAMIEKELSTGLPDMAPYHVAKWNPDHVGRALEDAGLQLLAVKFQPLRPERAIRVVREALHVDAMDEGSFAAQIYKMRARRARQSLLILAALVAARRLVAHLPTLARTDSFLAVGGLDLRVDRGEDLDHVHSKP